MNQFENLKPVELWSRFSDICNIPRASKKEAAFRAWLKNFAKEKNFSCKEDRIGNVLISVPASKGFEKSPIVVLQGHMDMVTEKNSNTIFDFDTQPIPAYVDGDWIRTKGTTLGADNGIGVAMALAVCDDQTAIHGPLEILCTVDEETGLTGATELDPNLLSGKLLINLDTEEEGAIYMGCAGGIQSTIVCSLQANALDNDSEAFLLSLTGLRGGHSGGNIHENRGNAIKFLARCLNHAANVTPIRLSSIAGGSKHNAIAREATALIVCKKAAVATFREAVQKEFELIQAEFGGAEPAVRLTIEPTQKPVNGFSTTDSTRALNLLLALPHGVLAMSRDIPGLVETSANVAIVTPRANQIEIIMSIRSSVAESIDGALAQVNSVVKLAGATIESYGRYPGWRPNIKSPLLKRSCEIWKKRTGKDAETKAIHAGLECGVILEKYPNMDAISIGPEIQNAHSPDECLHIGSSQRLHEYFKELLKSIAESPLT